MRFTIRIDMENAAFEDNGYCREAARILKGLAMFIEERTWEECEGNKYPLFDTNGNKTGVACFADD